MTSANANTTGAERQALTELAPLMFESFLLEENMG